MTDFDKVLHDLKQWASTQGIDVQNQSLPPGKAGEFTGTQVRMNREFDAEERTYYLAHALGSIAIWSQNKAAVQKMFDELRDAKQTKATDRPRLDRAISSYRNFETKSSELAAWLLTELGWSAAIDSFTNFMRADLESMTEFHWTGRAPVWHEFFARWNADVQAGRRRVEPYPLRPMPPFRATEIEKQEILQQQAYAD